MDRDVWSLPVRAAGRDVGELTGFAVEAQDGPVGTVARAAVDAGHSYLVVSLAPGLGVAKAMLPAGIVERVDSGRAVVRLACSRAQLAAAPRFESDRVRDGAYRAELAIHYAAHRLKAPPRQTGASATIGRIGVEVPATATPQTARAGVCGDVRHG